MSRSRSCLLCTQLRLLPLDLEFDFLVVIAALVFDIEAGAHWHIDALAGDLDLEALAVLQSVGQAPELVDEVGQGIVLPRYRGRVSWVLSHVTMRRRWISSAALGRGGLSQDGGPAFVALHPGC